MNPPFHVDSQLPWLIRDDQGVKIAEVKPSQSGAELCALLNAGWEAKIEKERFLAEIRKPCATPESRIARDLGVPVEELIEIATEEAKRGGYTPLDEEGRAMLNEANERNRPATPAEVQEVCDQMAEPQHEPGVSRVLKPYER